MMRLDDPGAPTTVTVRLYAELNDCLPQPDRPQVTVELDGDIAVGQLIEQMGVPLSRVDLILLEGRSVHPDHPLRPGDRVAVYPVFESFDVSSETKVRTRALRTPRFLVDADLGGLATLLEQAGFDVRITTGGDMVEEATTQSRILLSSDQEVIDDPRLTHGLRVGDSSPRAQLTELARRLHLRGL